MRRAPQYAIAATMGLIVLLVQCFRIYAAWGLDLANPKAQTMQMQLFARLDSNPGALLELAGYVFVAVVAHVALTMLSLFVFRVVAGKWRPSWLNSFVRGFAFVLLVLLACSFWNRMFFPMSRVFESGELLMVQAASPVLVWGSSLVVLAFFVAAVIVLFAARPKLMGGAAGVLVLVCLLVGYGGHGAVRHGDQPDIIVLGIDSLRPDFLPAYGFGDADLTPSINSELAKMAVFDDALTPLARTFVSYTSVITGENPATHGVRFNLYPRSEMRVRETLATRLAAQGYQTMLAMDESRFANFDGIFGFQEVIGPEQGALDFIVGGNYDFLATNLVLKIPFVSAVFPHVVGNRAAYRTYQAGDHPRRVMDRIRGLQAAKPLFLISHLCLPHWPYLSAGVMEHDDFDGTRSLSGYADSPGSYLRALRVVDRQFADILASLRESGRLENALVIIMSDHGESFAIDRDAFVDMDIGGKRRDYFGHGGFSLADKQNHVVLAMQRYRGGKPEWAARNIAGDASLIDIAPTVAATALYASKESYEGKSLMGVLNGDEALAPRYRFVESGIRSTGVEKADIDERQVANEMAFLYRIESDLRFEIRPELLMNQLKLKQRGVVFDGMGVAVMPPGDNPGQARSCWLAVNYEDRTQRCVGFPANEMKVARMQAEVCSYFKGDPGFDPSWCEAPGGPVPSRPSSLR